MSIPYVFSSSFVVFQGLKFDIIPSDFNESSIDPSKYNTRKEYVLDIAKHKVADVFETLKRKNALPDFIIGADTIVVLKNQVFGKPKDKEQAAEFLNAYVQYLCRINPRPPVFWADQ